MPSLEPSDSSGSSDAARRSDGGEDQSCFRPEDGLFDTSCLTDREIAALLADSDGDGVNNLREMQLGLDPADPTDSPDVDGDGIPNHADPDVDDDGVPNAHDFDIDGDGIFNDHDSDIDADGLLNDDDPDSDGDGLSDRFDLNDDGDDEPDDEDDDDDDDEPKEKLEDLIDRLKEGELTEADKNAIAKEISERLGTLDKQATFQAALVDVVAQSLSPDREQPDGVVPPGIAAVDAVYRQLADSLAYVRAQQKDPKAPLSKEASREVALDFAPRAEGIARLGRTFQTLAIDDLGAVVSDLRTAAGPERFPDIAQLATIVDPDARGTPANEHREIALLTQGISRLARAFPEAAGGDVVDALGRLRELTGDDSSLEEAELERVLSRVEELATGDQPKTIDEAIDQVEREEQEDEQEEQESGG